MIVYVLTFIVSFIIAILFLKINLKNDLKLLITSYANSSKIMLNSNNEHQQEEMFKELRNQFKLLFVLMAKFLLILSPCLIIIAYTNFNKSPIHKFFDSTSFIISIAAFLIVYTYNRYAKPQ